MSYLFLLYLFIPGHKKTGTVSNTRFVFRLLQICLSEVIVELYAVVEPGGLGHVIRY
jgi:hypothetical protein